MESATFSMPNSIGGASGAIKLNANLASNDDNDGNNRGRGATKNSANCGC